MPRKSCTISNKKNLETITAKDKMLLSNAEEAKDKLLNKLNK